MDDKLCQEFEEDPYIERLLKLRKSDPVIYYTYPAAVRDVAEEYEREKEVAQKDKPEQK